MTDSSLSGRSWLASGLRTPATALVDLVAYGADRGGRMGEQAQVLANEGIVTLQAMQRVLLNVADALDDGLLDDVRAGLKDMRAAVQLMEQVSAQIDQAMPVIDATAPTLNILNSTLAQLNSTMTQLDQLPGIRMARRFVSRPTEAYRDAGRELGPGAAG